MKKTTPASLVGLLAFALSTNTYSQETVTLSDVEVVAPPLQDTGLNASATTASRLGLTLMETPASVEVLDEDTMRKRGDYTVQEAVSRTAGITSISNLGSGLAFSARGFTGNDSVGQAEDGIRLLTAAGTLTYPSDTWGYERIEVLRGPASVLFGDGTVGGIINSIRKAPSRESSFDLLVGGGTQGEYRVGVGGTGAVGENGAFRVDASVTGGDGYVDRGDHKSQKLMTGLLFTPSDNLTINFTFDHSDESPSRYTGIPLRDGRIDPSMRRDNYDVSDGIQNFIEDRLRAKVEWQLSNDLKLANVSYWFNADRH